MMEKNACLPYNPKNIHPHRPWVFKDEEHSDLLELTEDNLSKITTVLPELLDQDRERMRREEAEKLKRLDELKQGRPEEMTVMILRDALTEMEVPLKLIATRRLSLFPS